MSEESENLEVPNWLSELEKKRERRLKARLGHEAGAGAPCIKCNENCPGLDLHFWRKICKNCKCSKEDHDVHDDDIYGWAQFQLLGSKPNKIKKKIILPGKKDEVELDWAPKGNTETIDRYLKTLAPESLPVKGSQAAQARKQLLQKQIPIHDIDPTLCHELTDTELAKMEDYIKNMRNSAGIGQVIQFGINYVSLHLMGEANAKFVSNKCLKGIPLMETVQLLGENKSSTLSKQFEKLRIRDQQKLDAFFDKIPNPHNMAAYSENVGCPSQLSLPNMMVNYAEIEPKNHKLGYNYGEGHSPHLTGNLDEHKLGFINHLPMDYRKPTTQKMHPSNYGDEHSLHNPAQKMVKDLPGQKFDEKWDNANTNIEINQNLENVCTTEDVLNDSIDVKRSGPNYINEPAHQVIDSEVDRKLGNLPHYAPGKFTIHSDQQNPTAFDDIRDMSFVAQNVDTTNSNYKRLQGFSPSQHQVLEDQMVPNRVNIGAIRDIAYENPEVKSALHRENKSFDESSRNVVNKEAHTKQCRKCSKCFEPDEFAIYIEKSDALYHSVCFKCAGCNQSLADLFYFYDKETDNIYCGRDFAKIRGIPRCKACDELIFVKEYCLAENSTFHLKHFCCFECDQALAGQNYVLEDSQPVCLPCYEKLKANKCLSCLKVIGADEEGVSLAEGIHFHANDNCFCCQICRKSLRGGKLLFKNSKLYCSPDCFKSDQ